MPYYGDRRGNDEERLNGGWEWGSKYIKKKGKLKGGLSRTVVP